MTELDPSTAEVHVNHCTADAGLAEREARALRTLARRTPSTWLSPGIVLVAGLVYAWWHRGDPFAVISAAIVFGPLTVAIAVVGQWALLRRLRRVVRTQCPAGARLSSTFGPTSVAVAGPDFRYEFAYSALQHAVQVGDVLVLAPRAHLVLALPMELVRPQDLERLQRELPPRSRRGTGR